MAPAVADAPVRERVKHCDECGATMLDGKCLDPDCAAAADQSLPKGALIDSTAIGAPSAFTIRGGVD